MPVPMNSTNIVLNLATAMVRASSVPLLLLDGSLNVIAVSATFCTTFGLESESVIGRSVFQLGAGEWDVPQFRVLLEATASSAADIDSYEMETNSSPSARKLVVSARKLLYGSEDVRLLVTLSDVTEARAAERLKDEMLRERLLLLRELQHRVANSLQIIASIIMQSARTVQSEEARAHLTDAHSRVLTIAALEKHLAVSQIDDVELREYFTTLCRSLSASMIRGSDRSIRTDVDEKLVPPAESVSLGLIVTELVINALKHAFPDDRAGIVQVGYRVKGEAWTLSVADDGVGMHAERPAAPGLGTSIVEALARQLDADVVVVDAHPGTKVSIVHDALQPDKGL